MNKDFTLKEYIGGGYDDFWSFRGRYRVVKGSRASKKSKTAALWFIHHMMQYPEANLLVVRKTYNSLRNSCFAELKWAIDRLDAADDWKTKHSPLELSYSKGGKVFFRGLGDAMRLTSITADTGKLCWVWLEEAFEVEREDDFNIIDESIRGKLAPDSNLFKQLTLTFNPWSELHWLKKRFFAESEERASDKDIFTLTTNYKGNEWLDDSDKQLFERMKADNPKRYKVAGLGEWGIADGLVYTNWESAEFDVRQLTNRTSQIKSGFGLDFGYTNDPSAFIAMLIDEDKRIIYVFDELYGYGLSNREIYEQISAKGYRKEKIFADSAEPKSIAELYSLGLTGVRTARKGADSVNHGIQFIQSHKIIILPKCTNFLKEISQYSWQKNLSGIRTNTPAGGHDHLMDAMRYALTDTSGGERWGF
jgi:phage terminase large subunit